MQQRTSPTVETRSSCYNGLCKIFDLGVAGAGYWGPNLIRNCAELGILDSVCDLDESALAAVARSYPGVATTTRFEELLARQIQGVIIATPAQIHASMCLEAIAAGKHVFVEKPLALTVGEGEQIGRAAAQAGLVVFVGHVLLYHPAVRKLRALLAEDVIGPIWHLRSRRLSLGKLRNHESVWWSFAPHDIALMLAIMGEEPRSVTLSADCFDDRRDQRRRICRFSVFKKSFRTY